MEGSVLSFLKAEWKVSDTGSVHLASSFMFCVYPKLKKNIHFFFGIYKSVWWSFIFKLYPYWEIHFVSIFFCEKWLKWFTYVFLKMHLIGQLHKSKKIWKRFLSTKNCFSLLEVLPSNGIYFPSTIYFQNFVSSQKSTSYTELIRIQNISLCMLGLLKI